MHNGCSANRIVRQLVLGNAVPEKRLLIFVHTGVRGRLGDRSPLLLVPSLFDLRPIRLPRSLSHLPGVRAATRATDRARLFEHHAHSVGVLCFA
jgi:hypothetical protein